MSYTIDVQSTRRYPPELAQAVARAAHEALTHSAATAGAALTILSVSYTHLDVYKRQAPENAQAC